MFHHLFVIALSAIVATLVGGVLGVKLGGLRSDELGIYNVSRKKTAMIIGGIVALIACALFHSNYGEGLVLIAISVFGARAFCSHLFYRYMWDGPKDGQN